eukprot:6728940-Prorocentrum_lima.AAC.1
MHSPQCCDFRQPRGATRPGEAAPVAPETPSTGSRAGTARWPDQRPRTTRYPPASGSTVGTTAPGRVGSPANPADAHPQCHRAATAIRAMQSGRRCPRNGSQ